jgi:hypothetical protein
MMDTSTQLLMKIDHQCGDTGLLDTKREVCYDIRTLRCNALGKQAFQCPHCRCIRLKDSAQETKGNAM